MKKLDRYVLRELMVPFLIGTLAVVLMFQANLLIYLFKTFSLTSVPIAAIAKLILYKTPYFLNMTLPVGMALATSLAMSRLTRESELTAMRAAGTSILRVMWPISLFGIVIGIGNFYLAEKVMPNAEVQATKLNSQLVVMGSTPEFKANLFIPLGEYMANFGSVRRQPDGSALLNDITLMQRPNPYEIAVFTDKEGVYRAGIWTFKNANMWYFKGNELSSFAAKDLVINQHMNLNELYNPSVPTEMSLEQLREGIRSGEQEHVDTTALRVHYYTRFSVPAACYVFAIVGPVFAIWLGRSGGFAGVLLSILMVLIYYNIFVVSTEVFGRNGWLSPVVSAWLPNVLFIVFAVIGLRRLE
jgi:lipopolysaccharide export system permease protein